MGGLATFHFIMRLLKHFCVPLLLALMVYCGARLAVNIEATRKANMDSIGRMNKSIEHMKGIRVHAEKELVQYYKLMHKATHYDPKTGDPYEVWEEWDGSPYTITLTPDAK